MRMKNFIGLALFGSPVIASVLAAAALFLIVALVSVAIALVTPVLAQDVTAGSNKYTMCATCHGVQGEGGMGGLAAKLAEQSPEEIVRKLTAYQNKEQVGPQSQMMWGFAAALTAEEIENLAAYIATLK